MEKTQQEQTSNLANPHNIKLNGVEYEIIINRKTADATVIQIRSHQGTFIKELTNANLEANKIPSRFYTQEEVIDSLEDILELQKGMEKVLQITLTDNTLMLNMNEQLGRILIPVSLKFEQQQGQSVNLTNQVYQIKKELSKKMKQDLQDEGLIFLNIKIILVKNIKKQLSEEFSLNLENQVKNIKKQLSEQFSLNLENQVKQIRNELSEKMNKDSQNLKNLVTQEIMPDMKNEIQQELQSQLIDVEDTLRKQNTQIYANTQKIASQKSEYDDFKSYVQEKFESLTIQVNRVNGKAEFDQKFEEVKKHFEHQFVVMKNDIQQFTQQVSVKWEEMEYIQKFKLESLEKWKSKTYQLMENSNYKLTDNLIISVEEVKKHFEHQFVYIKKEMQQFTQQVSMKQREMEFSQKFKLESLKKNSNYKLTDIIFSDDKLSKLVIQNAQDIEKIFQIIIFQKKVVQPNIPVISDVQRIQPYDLVEIETDYFMK